ncbi:related to helicase-like transcription factor [Lecanosticta acicola]|uniref:Related to helicase-like transcription factor n=1 Tax=Lecanosticta acicola TaxID=111012 RepID=A0AAI8Z2D0_9PEZI|nr:related to helicase-like transcription factor [Lecanosticta acicola]
MPPVSESDTNKMSQKASARADGKRKRVEIDLTASDDDLDAPAKMPKNASEQNARNRGRMDQPGVTGARVPYATPPTSSASRGRYESVNGTPSSSLQQHSQPERDSWQQHGITEDDFNEIISSSQQDTDYLHQYGELATKVVGVQYYRGYANSGEQILIRREPSNPYDSNAIRVDDVQGTQIGHIPRGMASKLAKYLDNRWLHLEGQLAGEIGQFDCPLTVQMYGPDPNSDEGKRLRGRMGADKLSTKTVQDAEKRRREEEKERLAAARRAAAMAPGKYSSQSAPAGGSQQQFDMSALLEASQRVNPREINEATDKLGFSEQELMDMPQAPKPGGIQTNMLPYQLQALQWLLDQENPRQPGSSARDSVQLWTKTQNRYTNLATNFTTGTAPQLASGGILADDMGLGKTLEMISLIVADAEKSGRGTTLIVAPLSVMSNWSGQISSHVKENHMLSVYTYHAAGRVDMKAADFEKHDVVLTTYQTLTADYMPRGSSKTPEAKLRSKGLYSVAWRRVILDEGHTVRNAKSKGTLAVTALTARSRWVLTGTPIVNSLGDLFSLLRFIQITGGLEQSEMFSRVLTRPYNKGQESAVVLLKLIMKAFTLRRRKDVDFIDLKLPVLDEFVQRIDFTQKERERYEALNQEAHGLVKKYEKSSNNGTKNATDAYQHLLEVLLRMRQCCNHWQMCGERVTKLMAQLQEAKTVDLNDENKKALQHVLQVQIESQEDCAICLETLHNPVITTCGHFFGMECISKVIETQHKCPMCRAELKDESVLVSPAVEGGEQAQDDDLDLAQSSSKLERLVNILGATREGKAAGKTVIFSQWTRFLDIVQARIEKEGYKFCRLDGTMSAKNRDDCLRALEQDDETTVMLASLQVCAVGLNLTAANNVILADTWWAPAIEDQAVDRVHRLGQKKQCRVFRLVMDGTIEERTLEVQAEKRKLMRIAFSEKGSKRDKARSGRLGDIKKLLA